ncbi:MAG TPA: 30S ribosomal protein S4 [Anaerolineaceae bacterium]
MAGIRKPKNKLSRREGKDLFGTGGPSLERRLSQPPGMHGNKPKGQQSEYARQLREKQKVKRMYGMREKQFQRFFNIASRSRGKTGEALLILLERRLDNVIYRMGFARTRLMSRQIVNHGHVMVDGKRVDISSFLVKPGQVVTLTEKAKKIEGIRELMDSPLAVPGWIESVDGGGRITRDPERYEIDADINETAIVEFYSR